MIIKTKKKYKSRVCETIDLLEQGVDTLKNRLNFVNDLDNMINIDDLTDTFNEIFNALSERMNEIWRFDAKRMREFLDWHRGMLEKTIKKCAERNSL